MYSYLLEYRFCFINRWMEGWKFCFRDCWEQSKTILSNNCLSLLMFLLIWDNDYLFPGSSRPTTGLTQRVPSASRPPTTGANTRFSLLLLFFDWCWQSFKPLLYPSKKKRKKLSTFDLDDKYFNYYCSLSCITVLTLYTKSFFKDPGPV